VLYAALITCPPPHQTQAHRAASQAKLRAEANQLVATHDPAAVAADRHSWLVFTVPERPVAGADCAVYFNKTQSQSLGWSQRVHMQVGYNQWQLGGEKLPLEAAAIPSVDNSAFQTVKFTVPEDAFEINMVFGNENGQHDNNLGQDFTFATEGGLTFEEWVDGAADRAIKAEAEEKAARAAAEAEAAAKALEVALQRDEAEAQGIVDGELVALGFRVTGLWFEEGGYTCCTGPTLTPTPTTTPQTCVPTMVSSGRGLCPSARLRPRVAPCCSGPRPPHPCAQAPAARCCTTHARGPWLGWTPPTAATPRPP